MARRGLRSWWRADGMLEVFAVLPPEDGAVVWGVLEEGEVGPPSKGVGAVRGMEGVVVDPAEDPWAARRADALVEVANQWLSGTTSGSPPSPRVVVHVDLASLVGNLGGGCGIEDGPARPAAVARRIGCDTELVAIAERDGAPLDVGRSRRTISTRQRLALQARDSTCRFPGCGVPAHRTEGHHLQHWADGGKTDLANLVLLCRFHHHRLHDGAFRIMGGLAGDLRFETAGGLPIGHRVRPPAARSEDDNRSQAPTGSDTIPRAIDGGARCDFNYVVEVLTGAAAGSGAARASSGR